MLPVRQATAKPARSPVGNIFVIAMENHNFTQPSTTTSPQQIFDNPGPLFLVVDKLSENAALLNSAGISVALAPLGSPYVMVEVGGDGLLRPHETKTVRLQFSDPSGGAVAYDARVLPVTPTP